MSQEYTITHVTYRFDPEPLAFVSSKPKGAEILAEVSKITGVSVADIKGHNRERKKVIARHCAMARIRDETDLSYMQIARIFGGRDHASIIYGERRWKEKWSKQ